VLIKFFPVAIALLVLSHLFAPGAALAQGASPTAAPPASAVALENITLLALSQYDGRVVLGFPDRKMVVLKVGDKVPRSQATVKQVLSDKIILQEVVSGNEAKQVVWMHKGQGGAPGRVERLLAVVAPVQALQAPKIVVMAMPKAEAGTPGADKPQP
jgi:hypothetical protein